MKKILLVILSFFLFFSVQAKEWKNKNKWKISCGVVNKESLIVNGKSKKYSKNEFKLEVIESNEDFTSQIISSEFKNKEYDSLSAQKIFESWVNTKNE